MRRGTSTLEYLFLIAMAVAVLISIGAYMKRGYQGHIRSLGDQIGGQYSPSTATVNNQQQKIIHSTTISKSDTNTTYTDTGDVSSTTSSTKEDTDESISSNISESMGKYANESWN